LTSSSSASGHETEDVVALLDMYIAESGASEQVLPTLTGQEDIRDLAQAGEAPEATAERIRQPGASSIAKVHLSADRNIPIMAPLVVGTRSKISPFMQPFLSRSSRRSASTSLPPFRRRLPYVFRNSRFHPNERPSAPS
jgi:hypothetical protein